MAYTPPTGNVVNFNFTGAYTPPAGSVVDFIITTNSVSDLVFINRNKVHIRIR